MLVNFKYFGVPIAHMNSRRQQMELPQGATIAQLLEGICEKLGDADPKLLKTLKTATFIVNQQQANADTILCDNDEVIITRVLGGG